jgi:hypothetical protein
MSPVARIPSKDALIAVHRARGAGDVVITTMSPARDWMTLPLQPLDVVFVPSAMGHATSVGLGLALAQHWRRAGRNRDGSMPRTSARSCRSRAGATNLVLLFDNGVYEVTGSQPTPVWARSTSPRLPAGRDLPAYLSSLISTRGRRRSRRCLRLRGRCS